MIADYYPSYPPPPYSLSTDESQRRTKLIKILSMCISIISLMMSNILILFLSLYAQIEINNGKTTINNDKFSIDFPTIIISFSLILLFENLLQVIITLFYGYCHLDKSSTFFLTFLFITNLENFIHDGFLIFTQCQHHNCLSTTPLGYIAYIAPVVQVFIFILSYKLIVTVNDEYVFRRMSNQISPA